MLRSNITLVVMSTTKKDEGDMVVDHTGHPRMRSKMVGINPEPTPSFDASFAGEKDILISEATDTI